MNRSIPLFLFLSASLFSSRSPDTYDSSRESPPTDALFEAESLLNINISGDLGELFKDRGAEPQYHPVTLSYKGADSAVVTLEIRAKTRGHFRKLATNCGYPPIQLNYTKESAGTSIFEGQDKMKLVMPCRDDRFVVREYLVYKVYNILTPKSFRARLVRVTLNDTGKSKKQEPFFGILLEEESQMARRNNTTPLEGKLVRPEATKREDFLNTAVFEYFIGNTDWSVQYMQNIKLLNAEPPALPSTVPYDFDHSGIVGAPYAQPRPELELASIRERRYRGFCINDIGQFSDVFARYTQAKDQIYAVYNGCPYLEKSYLKSVTRYIDEFYETINDPKAAKRDFLYPCQPGNTGNIVIRPLD